MRGPTKLAFDALSECLHAAIEPPQQILAALPTCGDKPLFPPFAVVPESLWRERCYAKGISMADQDAKKKAFARARRALSEMGLVHGRADHYWLANWCEQHFLAATNNAGSN